MKIILYIAVAGAIGFVSFVSVVIVRFAGSSLFYGWLIVALAIVLMVFIFLHLFGIAASRTMKKLWLALPAVTVISCAINEGYRAYDGKFERLSEDSVHAYRYRPFAEDSQLATLDGESTLRFSAGETVEDSIYLFEYDPDLPRLDGATALYPVYAAFAQAVYPEKYYEVNGSEVMCSTTPSAWDALINRVADIIFVAAPSQQQLDAASAAGVQFRYTAIGREAFVFFVSPKNTVDGLTQEQLRHIYSGKITNWKEAGGNSDLIQPFQRNEGSGSQSAFVRFMGGATIIKPPTWRVPGDMGGMVREVADYQNHFKALGFSFRFFVNEMAGGRSVKLLKIDGVYPDISSIRDGSYPLASAFYAVTLEDNRKPHVLQFLDWMVSPQGQQLIKKTGYCPIR
jgi:phosphate transport system substrate-binding protein